MGGQVIKQRIKSGGRDSAVVEMRAELACKIAAHDKQLLFRVYRSTDELHRPHAIPPPTNQA